MKLRCIKDRTYHWGLVFTSNNFYEVVSSKMKEISIITDYDKYWYYTELQSEALPFIRKGYKQDNLHEVIPGYISIEEKEKLFSKKIMVKFLQIVGEDGSKEYFCELSKEQLLQLGADQRNNKITFEYTNHLVDDYFDYREIKRDITINKILQ